MDEASLVTEMGTSLLCSLASISPKKEVSKKCNYEERYEKGHTAKNQILIPSLANSQTYTPPPPAANPAP